MENFNILFDFLKIRIELKFLNKNINFNECEKLKYNLKNNLSEIIINNENYYLKYFEPEQIFNENMLILNGNSTFILFFVIIDLENEKEINENKYKNIFENYNFYTEYNKNLSKLIYIYKNNIENNENNYEKKIFKISENKINNFLKEIIEYNLNIYIKLIKSKENLIKNNNIDEKNLLEIKSHCEEYLQIKEFEKVLKIFNILENIIKIPSENNKFKELKIITEFIENFEEKKKKKEKIIYNEEIYSQYQIIIQNYKKLKQTPLLIESIIRLITILSFFLKTKKNSLEFYNIYFEEFENLEEIFFENIQKFYKESLKSIPANKYKNYIILSNILKFKNYKRKSNLFFYFAIKCCFEDKSMKNILPILFKEFNKNFYDLETENNNNNNNEIFSYEDFNLIHKKLFFYNFKPISFFSMKKDSLNDNNNNKNLEENFNKRIDKNYFLYVKNNLNNSIKKKLYFNKWNSIEYYFYEDVLNYYNSINNIEKIIKNQIEMIQLLNNYLIISEQKSINNNLIEKNKFLQNKILNVNLINFPILKKILPKENKIKIIIKNNQNQKKNNIFIYNPWEKKEKNYYWSENSKIKLKLIFINNFNFDIEIKNLNLIYNNNEENFNYSLLYYNTNYTIYKGENEIEFAFKILPKNNNNNNNNNFINIKGINYEINSILFNQFVDKFGNGLFNFNCDKNNYLNNINIYSEIPELKINCLNNDIKNEKIIDLFEYEEKMFNFEIINNNNNNNNLNKINKIIIEIFGYKKEEYKIEIKNFVLNEINFPIKFDFNYNHKKIFIKIEFKFNFYTENSNEYYYINFIKKIKTKKILNFSNLKIISILTNFPIFEKIIKKNNFSNFNYKIISKIKFYNFILGLKSKIENKFIFDLKKNEQILKEDIIKFSNNYNLSNQEIYSFLNDEEDFSKNCIEFFFNEIKGKINFKEIFKYEFHKFLNEKLFDFDLKIIKNDFKYNLIFNIKNLTKKFVYENLIINYLFYTFNNNNININDENENIFYSGVLFDNIKNFEYLNEKKFEIEIFPLNFETNLNFTFYIKDEKNNILYFPDFSQKII